jgi:hypothetical protein
LARAPSARTVARLLTLGRERLSKSKTMTVAATESGVAVLVEAREIILEFQGIIRRKALAELDTWISRARSSLVAAFANGVSKDTKQRSRRRSRCRGPTGKPKARYAS